MATLVAMTTLVARHVEKLVSCNPCTGLECKEPQRRPLSPRNIKRSFPMAIFVTGYCQKAISASVPFAMNIS